MFTFITNLFKSIFDFIPKLMYLMYASIACLLDVLQLFFRKLAGLDIVYITDPVTGQLHKTTGDLLTQFITGILGINKYEITYSILSTVFWSFVIFGVIILFVSTLVAVIKSHYNYDEKAAKGPMQYVYTALRSVVGMCIVPIVIVLGMYLSQALLNALDSFTSTSNSAVVTLYGNDMVTKNLRPTYVARSFDESNLDKDGNLIEGKGEKSYVYYDIFGAYSSDLYNPNDSALISIAATNAPFSGTLFKAAAYNANRARISHWYSNNVHYSGEASDEMNLFKNAKSDENLAEMIDMAFACNLHTQKEFNFKYNIFDTALAWVSPTFFTQFLALRTYAFSKFNVGAVWYYYDLWQFNFIVGFGGVIVCFSIFLNIILGLMTRLFMCLVLFFIAPPMYGLAPLDNGQAAKNWRENFIKQFLMTYGAVVGMNLVLLILPYVNEIKFFNIGIADAMAQTLFIIVGLITIKAVIATISSIIGAADANKTGDEISKDVGGAIGGALKMTAGAAKFAGKLGSPIVAGLKTTMLGYTDKQGYEHRGLLTALTKKYDGMGNMVDRKGVAAAKSVAKKVGSFTGSVLYGAGLGKQQRAKFAQASNRMDEFMKEYEGQDAASFNKDEAMNRAMRLGFDYKQASSMAESIAASRNADGKLDYTQMQNELADRAGFRYVKQNERAGVIRRANVARNSVYNRLTGSWADANPFHWMNKNLLGAHQGVAAVRDAIAPPPDWNKITAERLASTNEMLRGRDPSMLTRMNTGINQGFANMGETMGQGFDSVNAGLGEVKGSVDTANRDTQAALQRGHQLMEQIDRDTVATRDATNKVWSQAAHVNKKMKENQKAHEELNKAVKELVDETKKKK